MYSCMYSTSLRCKVPSRCFKTFNIVRVWMETDNSGLQTAGPVGAIPRLIQQITSALGQMVP